MNKNLDRYSGWILLILGTIGLLFANYFEVMFARILWCLGFAIILANFLNRVGKWG
jgi:hypothetical protein